MQMSDTKACDTTDKLQYHKRKNENYTRGDNYKRMIKECTTPLEEVDHHVCSKHLTGILVSKGRASMKIFV